jgi:hypothetical protein
MADEKIDEINRRYQKMADDMVEVIAQFVDLSNYVNPARGMFTTLGDRPNEVEGRWDHIIDGTPIRAGRVLAAGMQAGITSPARPWFRATLPDPGMMKFNSIKLWLSQVENVMRTVLATSNFYSSIHQVYDEEGTFGTGVVVAEEHPQYVVWFRVMTAGEYMLSADRFGRVDTMYRLFYMTPRQAKQSLESRRKSVPEEINKMYKDDPDKWYPVLHAVEPNNDHDPEKITSKAFSSNYVIGGVGGSFSGFDTIVSASGFNEQPMACPRWSVVGSSVYGIGPGHGILGDSKMLQEMQRSKLKALAKMVDPPLKSPSGMKNRIKQNPGGVTIVSDMQIDKLNALYQVVPDIRGIREEIAEVREQIKAGMFNDLFLFIQNNPYATATEIIERHEEKLIMLGPVTDAQEHDLLDVSLDRVFGICARLNLIPPMPKELVEEIKRSNIKRINIDYMSILSQAQKQLGHKPIDQTLTFVERCAKIKPDVTDVFNFDEAVRTYADQSGAEPKLIVAQDIVTAQRAERIKQAAMMKAAEMKAQQIESANTLSRTEVGADSALDRVAGNA